jgi:hypothetical protein
MLFSTEARYKCGVVNSSFSNIIYENALLGLGSKPGA